MALLLVFAFVAGAGTAITPCVLPVLPALLSATASGGRRRPLGTVVGLTLTHTIAIVALATLIDGVGLAGGLARTVAIAVLAVFGVSLLIRALGDRIEGALARLTRFGPRTPANGGDGFRSGLLIGGALGFLYAPCAGPVLAAVVSVSAAQGASAEIVAVAIAYGFGSGMVLLALALGGRRLTERIRALGRGPALQRALGVVMIATAVAMTADLDVRFQTALANDFPDLITNPTKALEQSGAVERRLADLRGESRFDSRREPAPGPAADLPALGAAPEFIDTQRWFNTRGGLTLTLAGLRGRVVLIDFWTYTCINCSRTLPYLKAWDDRYRKRGLSIVGVHTPEFQFEKDADNVGDAIAQNGLRYPVAQDNDYGTWTAWGNQYWPAKYLIDASGQVRYTHFGEGDYAETERAIRALLEEAGQRRLGADAHARVETAARDVRTPETYLGFERAKAFLPKRPKPGVSRFPGVAGELPPNRFAFRGGWSVGRERATSLSGASLRARFIAGRVFLVLGPSPRGDGGRMRVFLDGRPIPDTLAGADVRGSYVDVRAERLYRLVALPRTGEHELRLEFDPGISAYAFTFG